MTRFDTIGAKMRAKRMARLVAFITKIVNRKGRCRILDIGGQWKYWDHTQYGYLNPLHMESLAIHITLYNLDPDPTTPDIPPVFTHQVGDGCNLQEYQDNAFDLVHSNSTIEHVGDYSNMLRFANNVRRLAPCYYVQVPYYWFPMEPHFERLGFHWLPEQMRASKLFNAPCGNYPRAPTYGHAMEWVQSARLLDTRQFRYLFPCASIEREKYYGLTKSLIAVSDRNY